MWSFICGPARNVKRLLSFARRKGDRTRRLFRLGGPWSAAKVVAMGLETTVERSII